MADWNRRSRRQQATLCAFAALGAAPIILNHGRRIFDPFMMMGGYQALLAWIALLALYWVITRASLDLFRDGLDYLKGGYRVAGGQYDIVDQRRIREPPYDCLSIANLKRDFSNWQYALLGSTFVEVFVGWAAFVGMLYAFFRSPYPDGSGHPIYLSHAAGTTSGLLWFAEVMGFLFVYFGLYSMGLRRDFGMTPLIQQLLGCPDTYPGQNTFPGWVNRLSLRLIGRPM
jgi:hypothetical protein